MRRRTKEVARLAAEKGYRLQREHPSSGDFWLWGHSHPDIPLVVGSLETIETFFALDEDHQMEMEGNASYAMREGLTALAALRGPHAVDELSLPVVETAAHYERAIAALKAYRKQQAVERLAAGSVWAGAGRVFTDELGRDLKPDSVTRSMERLVRLAGLPRLTPHGLRHTFATVGLESGVDVVYVSELLGHASPAVTMAVYQHTRPERLADANRRISRALLGG